MITLTFHFPAGHYHATPWGHHVNEGLVEWPPCPWRILRALIATGYGKLGWSTIPDVAQSLLQKLQENQPVYQLPPASLAHSRHYMPLETGKTTLVLDTWLNISQPLQMQWSVVLDEDEQHLLQMLTEHLNYLGRSESWVNAEVHFKDMPLQTNCKPHRTESQPRKSAQEELINLLSPWKNDDYAQWRIQQLPPEETGKQTKKQIAERKKQEAPYPLSVLDSLQWDTVQWKKQGWSIPPGSQWVQYRRPLGIQNSLFSSASAPADNRLDLFLLSLSTASGNSSALPNITRTLPQAELLHQALVSRSDPEKKGNAPVELTGQDHHGHALTDHRHSHILPLDLDEDGHLDHILLWAPMGFSPQAQIAIRETRRTWSKKVAGDLHLLLAGCANRQQLENIPVELQPYIGKGKTWISSSPFVPPRFVKKNGVHSLEGQIRAELKQHDFPEPQVIEIKCFPEKEELPEKQKSLFRHYIRQRSRGGVKPPQDMGFFIKLIFPEDVQGPICLGYGSHFGMGMMRCENM